MNLLNFFQNKRNSLIFSFICGIAYFVFATSFAIRYTATKEAGMLLAFFFFPTIICGAALVIFKALKNYTDNERTKSISVIFYFHLFVILVAIITLIGLFI